MYPLLYCLCLSGGPHEDIRKQPPPDAPSFFPGMLVHAKAVEVETSTKDQKTTFLIDYVYTGNPNIKGRTFIVHAFINFGFGEDNKRFLHLPIKKGEIGIWRVRRGKDGKTLIGCLDHSAKEFGDASPYLSWLGAIPTPGRRVVVYQVPYRITLQWARTVEDIYKKNDTERIPLLKAAALSDNPYVAAWSIYVLGNYKPKGLAKFLEEIASNEKLSVAGQVAVDELLTQLLRREWQNSQIRQRLFDKWANGEIVDTEDAERVIHHLAWAVKHKEVDWPTYLQFTTRWLTTQNVDYWYGGKLFALSTEGELSPEIKKQIYEYSIRIFKESKEAGAKKVGALWLAHLHLTELERMNVEKLLKDVTDPEIASYLRKAMESGRKP